MSPRQIVVAPFDGEQNPAYELPLNAPIAIGAFLVDYLLIVSQVWLYSLISVIVVSLIPLAGLFILFSVPKKGGGFTTVLIGLAVGALLGDVFLHIIPEILTEMNSTAVAVFLLGGILIFFILEKFLLWRHHHHFHGAGCQDKILPVGYMSLISDGLHNFIDGAIIAAAFLTDFQLGLATAAAVVLHEIPQEMGDIGVLLHAGFTRSGAVWFNVAAGALAIAGAAVALSLAAFTATIAPFVLALAAGGFIYIAGSDLIPELHKRPNPRESLIQLAAIIIGVALMLSLLFIS